MEIELKYTGINGLHVKASGRLDLDTSVEFGSTVKNKIEDADEEIKELVIDFEKIVFISSLGLKVILELYKQMKQQDGTIKLINVADSIADSFKMVGFDKFLEIE